MSRRALLGMIVGAAAAKRLAGKPAPTIPTQKLSEGQKGHGYRIRLFDAVFVIRNHDRVTARISPDWTSLRKRIHG